MKNKLSLNIIKISAALIAILLIGFVAWLVINKENNQPIYKEFNLHSGFSIQAEVPVSWSILTQPEMVGLDKKLSLPTASIGKYDVEFGDMNWSQADIFLIDNDIIDQIKPKGVQFEKEIVGGLSAEVIKCPIPNEEAVISLENNCGDVYYIRLPEKFHTRTLIINQQSNANEEFRKGFEHFIQTLEFKTD